MSSWFTESLSVKFKSVRVRNSSTRNTRLILIGIEIGLASGNISISVLLKKQ